MAKLFDGKKLFASAIKPTGGQPLDDRTVVSAFSDLTNASTFVVNGSSAAYKGMLVAVIEDQQVYMLVDETKITSEDAWVAVGSGNGSLSVETYAEAVALATNDNIGQIIYVKTTSSFDADGEGEGEAIEYAAAPYIVIGEGQLQKLAASEASGDLDSAVAELKTKVAALEGDMTDAEAEIAKKVDAEAYNAKVAEIEGAIEGVDSAAKGYADAAQAAAEATAAADATSKADAAQAAAEATAAADATAKANAAQAAAEATAKGYADAAEAAAKGHADGLNNAMDERVKALEEIEHDAYVGADAALKLELEAEIAKKVDAEAYNAKVAEIEGAIEGVEKGAQVNKLEVVKVNGQALTIAEADKSVDITIPSAPVQGVAADEKVLSLDGDKLKTTLTLAYVPASGETNAVLRLQGKDGVVVSSIDATAFVKDGMLEGAKLEGPKGDETGEKYLVLTFNTAAGKEDIRMDVTDLLDYYTAGDGLVLDGKTFAIQLDATAESYLKVTTNGLAVSDALWTKVTELDNAVLGTANTTAKGYADAAQAAAEATAAADATAKANAAQAAAEATAAADATSKANAAQAAAEATAAADATSKANAAEAAAKGHADGLNSAMDERVKALEEIDHDHENKEILDSITAEKVAAWDGAEQNAKDYADQTFVTKNGFNEFEAAYEEKLNGIAAGAEVNVIEAVKVNGIDAVVSEGKVAELEIAAKNIELGVDITGATGDAIYSGETKISTVLQGIQDSIRAAVAGGVNSVTSADSIVEVNNADANNPKVSLKVEVANDDTVAAGHIELVKGENGLYGFMYYDGDDSEVLE